LRHDCDNDLVAAVRLADIEAEEGVHATYFLMLRSAMYNLLAPTNARLVRQLLGCGHWLGLHFDESLAADEPDDRVANLVDRERALVSEEFGVPIEAVSFHQPGKRVLDNRVRLNCVNTYDRRDMAGLHYTSDSNLAFRGGEPAALFRTGEHPRLQVLIHPEWWTKEEMPVAAKWDRMLLDNLELAEESLRHREATYGEKRRPVLNRKGET
jgi:peptidoglycan/xylan/chitin deacetylase (PgdA/CDA1 family)